jgi:glutamine synthetase type III
MNARMAEIADRFKEMLKELKELRSHMEKDVESVVFSDCQKYELTMREKVEEIRAARDVFRNIADNVKLFSRELDLNGDSLELLLNSLREE